MRQQKPISGLFGNRSSFLAPIRTEKYVLIFAEYWKGIFGDIHHMIRVNFVLLHRIREQTIRKLINVFLLLRM